MIEYEVPGFGEQTSEYCNQVVSATYCQDCGHVEPRFYHCNKWVCPECYFQTATRAAHRVEERLSGVQEAYAKIGKFPGRIHHVTFSVPESEYENFDTKAMRKKCIDYAKKIGIHGGAVVFHPYRVIKEYRAKLLRSLKDEGTPGGIWRAIHEDRLNLGSWRKYVYFSPHFHVLGYYPRILIKSSAFHEVTGWVYKAVGVTQERSIFRTARYVLTHHAVTPGHAVVYFGCASYSKTATETIKTTEFASCPKCDSDNYFLIECGEWRYNEILEGRIIPSEESLLIHVRKVKKIKRFFVRLKTDKLTA